MSLARLWQQQGKRAEAYELLAPIDGWFTRALIPSTSRKPRHCLVSWGHKTVIETCLTATLRPRVSQVQEVTARCASWPTTCSKQQPLTSGDRDRHGCAACGRPRHEARFAPQPAAMLQYKPHPSLRCATTARIASLKRESRPLR